MILRIYSLLVRILAPALCGLVWLRSLYGHEENSHAPERRGISNLARPAGRLVWIHAASVGEMRSILPLAQALLARNPDLYCLITTVTVTAARLARRSGHSRILHQYAPLDHPDWVQSFLTHWQPNAVLWVESELWPNMLMAVKERGLPLIMVNGRLSVRSAERWSRIPKTIAHVLNQFDVCLAQSSADADRLKALGARDVKIAGNMKYAGSPLPYDAAALAELEAQIANRAVFLFASTHDGEEAIAARVFGNLTGRHVSLLGVIIPRHPSRGPAIAEIMDRAGRKYALRSKKQPITDDTQIYIADTLGELGVFYRAIKIVYLGNSLITVPGGGHNPIEPAQLGCAIIYGPNMWNFAEIDRDLRVAGGAIVVRDENALSSTIERLIKKPEEREALSRAAKAFVEQQNGILESTLAQLRPYLARAGIAS